MGTSHLIEAGGRAWLVQTLCPTDPAAIQASCRQLLTAGTVGLPPTERKGTEPAVWKPPPRAWKFVLKWHQARGANKLAHFEKELFMIKHDRYKTPGGNNFRAPGGREGMVYPSGDASPERMKTRVDSHTSTLCACLAPPHPWQ